MKKTIFACALGAFGMSAWCGDLTEKQGKDALEGFYAGAGLCYMHTINKGAMLYDGTLDRNVEMQRVKSDKIGGSLVAGYGVFATGNFYFGGELTLDIAGNKTENVDDAVYGLLRTKVHGFVPTLALRFGGYCNSIDTLFYGRIGLANVRSDFEPMEPGSVGTAKVSRLAPVLGVGVEKKIACVNLRLEGDYRFQADKDKTFSYSAGYKCDVRNRTKGYTVRLMAVYNF